MQGRGIGQGGAQECGQGAQGSVNEVQCSAVQRYEQECQVCGAGVFGPTQQTEVAWT